MREHARIARRNLAEGVQGPESAHLPGVRLIRARLNAARRYADPL